MARVASVTMALRNIMIAPAVVRRPILPPRESFRVLGRALHRDVLDRDFAIPVVVNINGAQRRSGVGPQDDVDAVGAKVLDQSAGAPGGRGVGEDGDTRPEGPLTATRA